MYCLKKWILYSFISLAVLFFFISEGCTYDKASLVYPSDGGCDTVDISLSKDLTPIMSANCFRCHSSSNAAAFGGNYNLEDYSTIKAAADDGRLISSIKQDGIVAPPMPQDGGKLSDCQISQFESWANDGAQDN